MDKERLEKLKKLAKMATPGPWYEIAHKLSSDESTTYLGNYVEAENKDTYPGYTYSGMIARNVCQINAKLNCRSEFWDEEVWDEYIKNSHQANKNRDYIMHSTPDVILELITEIEQLQEINKRLVEIQKGVADADTGDFTTEEEIQALNAKWNKSS